MSITFFKTKDFSEAGVAAFPLGSSAPVTAALTDILTQAKSSVTIFLPQNNPPTGEKNKVEANSLRDLFKRCRGVLCRY